MGLFGGLASFTEKLGLPFKKKKNVDDDNECNQEDSVIRSWDDDPILIIVVSMYIISLLGVFILCVSLPVLVFRLCFTTLGL